MLAQRRATLIGLPILLLTACGASVTVVGPESEAERLRNFNHFYVRTITGEAVAPVVERETGEAAPGGETEAAPGMSAAGERLALELVRVGFEVVKDAELADVIAELRVGRIHFNPIMGSVADDASVVLRTADDNRVLLSTFAASRSIAPPLKTVIRSLARAIRTAY